MRMTVIAGTVTLALAGLVHLTAAQSGNDKDPKAKLATRQVILLIDGMT